MTSTVLVSTWNAGLFVFSDSAAQQELPGRLVTALAPDGQGGVLAIVDRRSLRHRAPSGIWTTLATAETDLSCCVGVGDIIYLGTDDPSLLRLTAVGAIEPLPGFQAVPGRDHWYAGSAIIDGKRVGPPLGVRSITATADGAVLLANVHVGGIPRSSDGGATWQPTIAIDSDIHDVCAHPTLPNVVAAAAAIGLCTSTDGGVTWEIEQRGLHALHCSAVAFAGDDVLVSASEGPFAPKGAIYRRSVDDCGPLVPVGGGLPTWLAGKVDTHCIAAAGSAVAVVDWRGHLYVSADRGRTWSHRADGFAAPNGVLIL